MLLLRAVRFASAFKVPDGRKGPKKRLMWTEKACLQLLEATMQVEEEIMNGSKPPIIKPSTRRPMGKWERISNLLPSELQGRAQPFGKYRCRATFDNILKAYRRRKDGTADRNSHNRLLTEAMHDLMIKRDEQIQKASLPTGWDPSLKTSAASDKVRIRSIAGVSQQPTSGRFLNTRTNQGLSFRRQSMGTTKASRSVSGSDLGPAKGHHKRSASPTRDSPSNSLGGESEDPGDFENISAAQTRFQDQGKEFSSTMRPPSQTAIPGGRRTSSKVNTRYIEREERRLRRRLDLEFSHLSSLVEHSSNLIEMKFTSGMARHAASSEKKRKLDVGKKRKLSLNTSASEPLDDLIYENLRRGFDLGIQASFQALRSRLAEEVKNTSIKLGRELRVHSIEDM